MTLPRDSASEPGDVRAMESFSPPSCAFMQIAPVVKPHRERWTQVIPAR
jgi:hypothetical protein